MPPWVLLPPPTHSLLYDPSEVKVLLVSYSNVLAVYMTYDVLSILTLGMDDVIPNNKIEGTVH